MRIEEDMKLDYKDVLIRPKRSTLQSRKQVRLERKFEFRNIVFILGECFFSSTSRPQYISGEMEIGANSL